MAVRTGSSRPGIPLHAHLLALPNCWPRPPGLTSFSQTNSWSPLRARKRFFQISRKIPFPQNFRIQPTFSGGGAESGGACQQETGSCQRCPTACDRQSLESKKGGGVYGFGSSTEPNRTTSIGVYLFFVSVIVWLCMCVYEREGWEEMH